MVLSEKVISKVSGGDFNGRQGRLGHCGLFWTPSGRTENYENFL